jgi:hypothetical protein
MQIKKCWDTQQMQMLDPGAQLIIARSSFKRNDMAAINVVMRVCNSNGAIAAGDVLQFFATKAVKPYATVKSLSKTMEVQVIGLRGLVVMAKAMTLKQTLNAVTCECLMAISHNIQWCTGQNRTPSHLKMCRQKPTHP